MGSEQAYNRLTEKEKEAVQAAREKRGGLFDRLFGITKETESQKDTTDKSAATAKEQQQYSDEAGGVGAPDFASGSLGQEYDDFDESAGDPDPEAEAGGQLKEGGFITRRRYGGLMGQ